MLVSIVMYMMVKMKEYVVSMAIVQFLFMNAPSRSWAFACPSMLLR